MLLTEHAAAIDRVFTAWTQYQAAPSAARLFFLLGALSALDDQLSRPSGPRFLDFPEAAALRVLRAFLVSQGNLEKVLRVGTWPSNQFGSDTESVCLISMADCRAALALLAASSRPPAIRAFTATFRVWGTLVDVIPCVTNGLTKTFQALHQFGAQGQGQAFLEFARTYEQQVASNLPHFVSGPAIEWNQELEELEELMRSIYDA